MKIKKNDYGKMILLQLVLALIAMQGFGQNKLPKESAETSRTTQRSYYRKTLRVDSTKSEKIVQIQADYKKSLNEILKDTTLNEATRRLKIKAIMEVKNQKYKGFLTVEQQKLVIPSTEGKIEKKQVQ